MLDQNTMDTLKQVAKGVALQFGGSCEVVIHEISENSADGSIVAIENGHVSGRKIGDGPSHIVLEQLGQTDDLAEDQHCYLTRTSDGKILKSSSLYIRDAEGKIGAIFSINYDISMWQMVENAVHDLVASDVREHTQPERIALNVAELLDDLIRQADELIGKPAALMSKEEKIKAIRYLRKAGAMMITGSGDKLARHFGISKYTLYSYLDNNKTGG